MKKILIFIAFVNGACIYKLVREACKVKGETSISYITEEDRESI